MKTDTCYRKHKHCNGSYCQVEEAKLNRMLEGKSAYEALEAVDLALANCTDDGLAYLLRRKQAQLHYELETWAQMKRQ